MHVSQPGRRCRQCGERILWSSARFVGSRTFCWEPCAIVWLFGAASRTAWSRIRHEMAWRPRSLRWRAQLAWLSWIAAVAQRRLDRRLAAAPGTRELPWLWFPSVRGGIALVVTLAACGLVGGRTPETQALALVPDHARSPGQTTSALPPVAALAPTPPVVAVPVPESVPPASVSPAPVPEPLPAPPPGGAPEPFGAPTGPPSPRPRSLPRRSTEDITRGDTAVREIALTFDGGTEANVVGEILDSLAAYRVRSTMFLTGQFIRTYPDWVRRIVAEGHEVANHLDTHPHLTTYEKDHRQRTLPGVTRTFLIGQLRRTEESFRALTGKAMAPFWRAPYGEQNAELRGWAAEAGYRHVSWTRGAGAAEDLDTRDWVADRSSRIYRSREEIATRILEFGNGRSHGLNGGIVLMHLNSNRQTDRPHEGLPAIIRSLQAQGYRFVTISALVSRLSAQEARVPAAPPLVSPENNQTSAR